MNPAPGGAIAPAPAKSNPVPLAANDTVGSVVQKWKKQLQDDVVEFKKQSDRVARWDNQLRKNVNDLAEIEAIFYQAKKNNSELEDMCTKVEQYQTDLDESLNALEKSINRHQPKNAPVDDTRRKVYADSEILNAEINNIGEKLETLLKTFNIARDNESRADGKPVGKIVAVLNQHLGHLLSLQTKTVVLDKQIRHLKDLGIGYH